MSPHHLGILHHLRPHLGVLRRVVVEPVVRFAVIVENDARAVVVVRLEDDGRTRVRRGGYLGQKYTDKFANNKIKRF